MKASKLLFRIRLMISIFVLLLVLSGITAFPLYTELKWFSEHTILPQGSILDQWLDKVWLGIKAMHDYHPFLFYGYDWLAFAHLVIAMAFIGPWKDPVRNVWIIEWAMLSCIV